jgi:excisionase family DNA binding protein
MTPTIRDRLEEISREVAAERPELAQRLARIADEVAPFTPSTAADYISTGEAAAALGVSVNTVKKWVRAGVIRDFWTLPASGYIKIARSEVERVRNAGKPRIEEDG